MVGRPTICARSDRVVVLPPCLADIAGVVEVVEEVLIEALLAHPAVEALRVHTLRWLHGSDEDQLDTALVRPAA